LECIVEVVKIEVSPHAKRRLAVRMISEDLVYDTIRNPERVLFDKESGYFIAVKKVNDKFLIVAYLLLEESRIRVITAFLTSDPNIVERRVGRGRREPL